jgi:hypothetical protein
LTIEVSINSIIAAAITVINRIFLFKGAIFIKSVYGLTCKDVYLPKKD